jgi:hypothetical protein
VRKLYEEINPVPDEVDKQMVPYWQMPDGSPVTRERLQSFIQLHMQRMGCKASVYIQDTLLAEGRCHCHVGSRCVVATDPAHGAVVVAKHGATVRAADDAAFSGDSELLGENEVARAYKL